MVRLVRACGSKHVTYFQEPIVTRGQARKSLWIETQHSLQVFPAHFGQARKSLWIETFYFAIIQDGSSGQARKSLWIETGFDVCRRFNAEVGQARKSLWIETERYRKIICVRKVRLVRACGSKPYITLAFNVIVGSGS